MLCADECDRGNPGPGRRGLGVFAVAQRGSAQGVDDVVGGWRDRFFGDCMGNSTEDSISG